ncbi:hypothetical protein PV08_05358 [Exophiala spinifera]|uniref:Uncharacterized protein n=1 Tax=Exophiala spinifera TaxID=91928 RepID=A0A0D2B8P4_9EURO|nr:uncharacterized protein PV08_05358 [Exophiala spinifera]KIW15313.1 hypothetical protein PV08_05358 [Exophiala spinifera]
MADPLGIVGVIGVAAQIIQLGVQFGLDWNDAPADTKSFIAELEVLIMVLSETKKNTVENQQFMEAFKDRHSTLLSRTGEASPAAETPALISACRSELETLLEDLKKRCQTHRVSWERLKSAFLAKRTRETVENLHRKCQALNSMALIDAVALGASTYNTVNQIHARQQMSDQAENDRFRIQRKTALLRKLYTSPYKDRKDRNPMRVRGTCEWFTHHPLFQIWKESKSSCVLLVSADPGCGKSVLAKYLVDEVIPSTRARTSCYFFFKDDFGDQRTLESCLCCILRQIFIQRPDLVSEEVLSKFEEDGEQLIGSSGSLWDLLIDITGSQDVDTIPDSTIQSPGEIFFVLDALDECENSGQRQLAEALRKQEWARPGKFVLKILLTSRPYTHIQREFGSFSNLIPTIHLKGEGEAEVEKISREIDVVIESKVKDLGSWLQLQREEQQILKDELSRIPHRTYLWVHLILETIKDSIGITKESLSTAVRNLPKTVEAVYEGILRKSHNPEKAKRILHIVVAAVRPMSLTEMAVALAIEENHEGYEDLDLEPEVRFGSTVREICGLFVTIIDSKIYLLHQTAKEFLVQNLPRDSDDMMRNETGSLHWKSSLRTTESHHILAEVCMWRLLWKDVASCNVDMAADSQEVFDQHILYDYAAQNWVTHFRGARMDDDHVMVSRASGLCHQDPETPLSWFKRYWGSKRLSELMVYPKGLDSLIIASFCGLDCVVKLLLEMDDINVNSKDDRYKGTPLMWAAEYGHEGVVKLLIANNEIDIDSENSQRRTPLSFAAELGHENVVKILLESGKVSADGRSNHGRTPFSYAASRGNVRIAELLLDTGQVDPNFRDRNNRTPIFWAAWYGRISVVRLLLQKSSVDVDCADDYGRTPLLAAARNGHEDVVESLLRTGKVDVNAADSKGRTPMWHASRRKHGAIVQLLRLPALGESLRAL